MENLDGNHEPDDLRDVVTRLNAFEAEVREIGAKMSGEYGPAMVLVARSIGAASITANALAEIIEYEGKK